MTIEEEEAKFGRDWEVDFSKLELRRKKLGFFRTAKEFFWRTRYPVLALYRWARTREDNFDVMTYPHIVNSDNLPPIPGLPTRIELNEGWSIPDRDLRYLIFGPLTKGNTILVPAVPDKKPLFTLWEMIKIFSTIGGAVTFLFFLLNNLSDS